ncbi:hypothetical protein CCR75_008062 [Bremia lactucae]|uniref:Secreted protein n=1 Tax=Bremia lactucae TaxID=4779 RepID=A0A976FN81_BRELC|nr:hypothetical protein CCR75_008062 [Bremia lactucae]
MGKTCGLICGLHLRLVPVLAPASPLPLDEPRLLRASREDDDRRSAPEPEPAHANAASITSRLPLREGREFADGTELATCELALKP